MKTTRILENLCFQNSTTINFLLPSRSRRSHAFTCISPISAFLTESELFSSISSQPFRQLTTYYSKSVSNSHSLQSSRLTSKSITSETFHDEMMSSSKQHWLQYENLIEPWLILSVRLIEYLKYLTQVKLINSEWKIGGWFDCSPQIRHLWLIWIDSNLWPFQISIHIPCSMN